VLCWNRFIKFHSPKLEGKGSLELTRCRWENSSNMNIIEIFYEVNRFIYLSTVDVVDSFEHDDKSSEI
jgi:hypothetical protein